LGTLDCASVYWSEGRDPERVHIQWGLKVLVVGALALVVIDFWLLLAWSVNRTARQEAAGQEVTVPAVTVPPATSTPAPVPFPERTEGLPSEPEPEGIPGLSVMEVIGYLEHFRTESGFVCDGPVPTTDDATGSMWVCSAPGGELPPSYEITIFGEGPLTVIWVAATARGVSEEQAAEFFSYVASLCLQETDPLNPEAWVEHNIGSGGEVSSEGAKLSIYGTKEERTLEVVATGFSTD
jgi:hypothetical protein